MFQKLINFGYVFVFKSGHRDQITCSLLGGFSKPRAEVPQSLDSGLCSIKYLVNSHAHSSALAPLHYAPLDPLVLLASSRSSSPSVSVPDPPALSCSTHFAFAVSQSMSAWSHHLISTFAPSIALAPCTGPEVVASQFIARPCSACLLLTSVCLSIPPPSWHPLVRGSTTSCPSLSAPASQ